MLERMGARSLQATCIRNIDRSRANPCPRPHRPRHPLRRRAHRRLSRRGLRQHGCHRTAPPRTDLQLAEEVGPKVADAVIQYFSEPGNRELVSRLRKAGLQFTYASTRPKAGPLKGKTLVITGTLPTLSRDDAKQLIEQAGGKVSAVSKKTSYVVVGEDAGTKLAKAQELGVPVLTEDELRALIMFP